MQGRSLNRRTLLIFAGVIVVLLAIVLVVGQGKGLFGSAVSSSSSVIDSAFASLSQTLGKTVTKNSNATFTWNLGPYPDNSIGCPQPGKTYNQTPTNGYKVVITYNGVIYDYRAQGDGSGVFLCSQVGASGGTNGDQSSASATDVPEPVDLINAVLQDLSNRKGVTYTRGDTKYNYFYSSYTDGSLDCPQSGKTYAKTQTWGWKIVLTPNSGGAYDYRAYDAQNYWLCTK